MAKEDIVQYSFRLNLENPLELKLHQQLLNVNMNVYKSKNRYIVKKLLEGIFGEVDDLQKFDNETKNEKSFAERDILELEEKITKKVTNELLKSVLDMVMENQGVHRTEDEVEDDYIDENIANAALGYFEEAI